MSAVRSVSRTLAATTFGSDDTMGPSGTPSTTSTMATESGRSTRRQVMRRQLTVARKNGSAYRPLDGSSRDGSTVSAPESIASSCPAGSTGSAGSSTMSGLLPAREREVEDVAHDAGELEVLRGVDAVDATLEEPGPVLLGDDPAGDHRSSDPELAGQPHHLRNELQVAAREDRQSDDRSEEHTSELQSLMRISYAVFCLKKTTQYLPYTKQSTHITILHTT